jgi:glyoxylase-like metal-dependent hydrolase (beta-lactamase superfamily II)
MQHGVGVTNAFVVTPGGPAAILFDAGASHAELHRAWPAAIDRLEAVFVTHYEPEHIGGLERVLTETGLPHFYGPPNGRWLTAIGLGEEEHVDLLGLRITTHSTPGHAPEHNCYTVGVAGSARPSLLISGDLIFAGSLGGGYFCCQRQLKHARRILEMLDDDVVIAPGHGPLTTVGLERRFNPFLV